MAEDAWAVSDHGQVAPSRSSDVDTSVERVGDSSEDGEEGEGEGGEGEDEGTGGTEVNVRRDTMHMYTQYQLPNSLSYTHTNTRTHSDVHTLSLSRTHTLSLKHAYTHSLSLLHTPTLSFILVHSSIHSLTHTYTHTHTPSSLSLWTKELVSLSSTQSQRSWCLPQSMECVPSLVAPDSTSLSTSPFRVCR